MRFPITSVPILVNLYFTYRWLLLECKREFPFNDSLRVLEVMWATLPIDNEPPELNEPTLVPFTSGDNLDDMDCSIPRASVRRRALSCPPMSLHDVAYSRKGRQHSSSVTCYCTYNQAPSRAFSVHQDFNSLLMDDDKFHCSIKYSHSSSPSARLKERHFESDILSSCSSNSSKGNPASSEGSSSTNWVSNLPSDDQIWLVDDNSFLLFLCIAILLAHRTYLLKQKNFDEQEIAMHFDHYRRRHNAEKLLKHARNLYGQYIQWARKKRMLEDLREFSAS